MTDSDSSEGTDPVDGTPDDGTDPSANADRSDTVGRSGSPRDRVSRLVEHLETESPDRHSTERRRTASEALATQARETPTELAQHLDTLVAELRRTDGRPVRNAPRGGHSVRETLVRCVSRVIIDDPRAIGSGHIEDFAGAVTTDFADGTLHVASKALFVGAGDRPGAFTPAVDPLGDLVTYPDGTVRAWSAGALGRLASASPDGVAAVADGLRDCLTADDETVTHNAVEALGGLVRERPDAVAPAAGALRDLLDHEDDAIQHNAAGVLGHLATDRPEAVVPAVEDLRALCEHDDPAVRRVATAALARLADAHPDADPVSDG